MSEQLLREWLKERKHKRSPWGEKLDSNGYSESLLPSDGCIICGDCDCARHEIFYGTADRQTSKATGMWIDICPKHHLAAHHDADLIEQFHKMAQERFEEVHSHEEFMTLFGKNYL